MSEIISTFYQKCPRGNLARMKLGAVGGILGVVLLIYTWRGKCQISMLTNVENFLAKSHNLRYHIDGSEKPLNPKAIISKARKGE